jgi:hypothetical protein
MSLFCQKEIGTLFSYGQENLDQPFEASAEEMDYNFFGESPPEPQDPYAGIRLLIILVFFLSVIIAYAFYVNSLIKAPKEKKLSKKKVWAHYILSHFLFDSLFNAIHKILARKIKIQNAIISTPYIPSESFIVQIPL